MTESSVYEKTYGHKVLCVILRFFQITCSSVVLGILGEFTARTKDNGDTVDTRIIYTLALAGICLVYSLACVIPFKLQFWAFPMDFALFVMWLTAFCLLETRTGIHTCESSWYRNYWGPNWVGLARVNRFGVVRVNGPGCSPWRAALAFAFIACIAHAVSTALGIYVWRAYFTKRPNEQEHAAVAKNSTSSEPRMSEAQMSEP